MKRFWLFLPTLLLATTLWADERVLTCTDTDGSGRYLDGRCSMVDAASEAQWKKQWQQVMEKRPATPCECNQYGCADCPYRCKVRPWRVRRADGTDRGGCHESPPNCVWAEKKRAKALENTVCSRQGAERIDITEIKTRDLVVERFQGVCPPIGLHEEIEKLQLMNQNIRINTGGDVINGPVDPHEQCVDFILEVERRIDE